MPLKKQTYALTTLYFFMLDLLSLTLLHAGISILNYFSCCLVWWSPTWKWPHNRKTGGSRLPPTLFCYRDCFLLSQVQNESHRGLPSHYPSQAMLKAFSESSLEALLMWTHRNLLWNSVISETFWGVRLGIEVQARIIQLNYSRLEKC